ncbi:non-ribosomal peptide synthetase [Microbulbifer sp. 2205BS26-8]|uniref:non-ribosomal peptide synthetase n=1 Tax=Microbulbifer sp. 2205BS26-8 TaxID=3064386 RepID=UPI00273D81D3|nr:non-ribosomal peptide synthetase [Microbulbifer sp. 2205BS26-8]MDP5209827.1 amino acid adenylation domain-containing protein [Microbulbifer sp. 2205BS26-8]
MQRTAQMEEAPIPVCDRTKPLPLSHAQQRLWFLDQMHPQLNQAYHISGGVCLRGHLDQQALIKALNRIVFRHEILRTAFVVLDGDPEQVILPADSRFEFVFEDLRESLNPEQTMDELIAKDLRQDFALDSAKLIRAQLYRLQDEEHRLFVNMHHIVSDAWSLAVFLREVSELYAAYCRGDGDPLPPLTLQYADYSVWQQQYLSPALLAKQRQYWKTTLADAPRLLKLPTNGPRPSQQNYRGASVAVLLNPELSQHLKLLSQRHGISLYTTLLAAWALVLSRLSAQEDIVIGTPVANRASPEIEGLIGFFVNTLALRIDLSGELNVAGLLARVKEVNASTQNHQDIPFELVVEALQPERSLSHSPLFQVMFAWQNAPKGVLDFPGLDMELLDLKTSTTQFDLSLSLGENGEQIAGYLIYSTALFDAVSVEHFLTYWKLLLQAMLEDERSIHGLAMLPESERDYLLKTSNKTREFAVGDCLHQIFEVQVSETPRHTALVFEDQRLSYQRLNHQANQLSHYLIEQGVGPDVLVGLCVERSIEMVVALLAILKAGGAYVPLDSATPESRLQFMLADSTPRLLISDRPISGDIPQIDITEAERWSDYPTANPVVADLRPDHLAYVIYTSGSTGEPKGVMVEHRQVGRLFAATNDWFGFTDQDVWTLFHSCAFDFSVWELWGALLHGGRLVVVPQSLARCAEDFYRLLCEQRVTVLNQTPSAFQQLQQAQQHSHDKHQLRIIILGGEALDVQSLKPWYAHNGEQTQLVNMYGVTETTVHASYRPLSIEDTEQSASPIGQRLPDLTSYILDRHHQPVPVGVIGELYIGGAGVARGYLKRAELTKARFIADPFSEDPNARLYKTGDLVCWHRDGSIEFIGRNDSQVKVRGFRIELGEIEARLREIESLDSAVVILDSSLDEKRLLAYCVSDKARWDTELLRSHLLQCLPVYMVPSVYIRLDSFPLTVNGKLDRKALPLPDGEAYSRGEYEAPIGELEESLAAIWSELLGVERVGRWDHFFALGGHSLLVVQLMSRLREAGWQLAVSDVFNTPVLADLAQKLEVDNRLTIPANGIPADGLAEGEKITPDMLNLVDLNQAHVDLIADSVDGAAANIQDIYPLAPLQEGILFHHLLQEQGNDYLLTNLMAFKERQHLDNFLEALQWSLDRHDILRTAIVWEGLPEPLQVVWRKASIVVEEIVISADGDAAEQLLKHYNPLHYSLDITRAPLLTVAKAFDAHKQRWLLLLLHHHLVDDNTSLTTLIREISHYLQEDIGDLPKPVPFRNFVAQTRLGVGHDEQEKFFTELLRGVDEPTAAPGPLNTQGGGDAIAESQLHLDSLLARNIRRCAQTLGVGAASLFHLAFARVLACLSGRDDVVFGTVLYGRMQGPAFADRAVGMFINTLPVRIDLGHRGVATAVSQTHQQLVQLMRYEHASLALVQRCTGVEAPLPLFTASLNYRQSTDNLDETAPIPGMEILHSHERTHYPVGLSIDDLGDGFLLTAQVVDTLGPQRLIAYLQEVLQDLVRALEQSPQRLCAELNVLGHIDQQQVLNEWSGIDRPLTETPCIQQLFEAQVERVPNVIAVVCERDTLNYSALNAEANRLAHYFIERGVKPDKLVALCVERRVEMVVAILAVLKAGGAYVPLDPSYPTERLQYMLDDSAPVLLLADAGGSAQLQQVSLPCPLIDLINDRQQWLDRPYHNPTVEAQLSSHLAYVMYTSGSTGQPKGVMVEHRQLVSMSQARLNYYGDVNSTVMIPPFSFDASVAVIWSALLSGARLVIPSLSCIQNTAEMAALMQCQAIEVLVCPQSYYAALLQEGINTDTLRQVICGGQLLPSTLLKQHDECAKHVQLYNEYGPTEGTIWASTARLKLGIRDNTIGRPVAPARLYILDQHGQLVPVGVVGELAIGGAGVSRGYLNQPVLSRECFVKDPFSQHSGARMYKTGDLARWNADGTIDFMGRGDHQVKFRGYRIELGEIESQLRSCEAIKDVAVTIWQSSAESVLVAYIATDTALDIEDLRYRLAKYLPDYMLPSAYVQLPSLPRTANGKVDPRALPDPDNNDYRARSYEAPVGEVEQALADIWSTLLGVEQISRWDNFFSLGGHSLIAIKLLGKVHEAGWQMDVKSLFNTPVLADLARAIGALGELDIPANSIPANKISADCESIEPEMLTLIDLSDKEIDHICHRISGGAANIQDIYPLAPLQEGILFHHVLHQQGDAYLLSNLLAFDHRQQLDKFLCALQWAVNRHDILRTAVFWEGLTEPVQVVCREALLSIEEVSLEVESDSVKELLWRFNPRHYRMDIGQAPMIKCLITFDAEHDRWLLLALFHHLVMDHETLELLVTEVLAQLEGRSEALAAPIPFRQFVGQTLLGVSKQEHERFFTDLLNDVDEPTAPLGIVDALGDGTGITELRHELELSLSRRLRHCANLQRVSPASLFHLAFARVLGYLSGRDDVVFGTVLFGRMQGYETDRALGMFMNTLPVRINVGDIAVDRSLHLTQTLLADLLHHEHASLAMAQRCSRVSAPSPLFTALLNYRHGVNQEARQRGWQGMEALFVEERSNYPLMLAVDDLDDDFILNVQVVDLLDADLISAYMQQVLKSLVKLLEDFPQTPCCRLDLLSAAQYQQLVDIGNAKKEVFSEREYVHSLFETQVTNAPNAIAAVCKDHTLTYADLNKRANQLAHYLRAQGVQPDQRIALCVERGLDMLISLLAILKAGAAYVPLDPAYPVERLQTMLADSEPQLLLIDNHSQGLFDRDKFVLPLLNIQTDQYLWQSCSNSIPCIEGLSSAHLAYVIYTSGSTGKPKGVMVEHRNLVNLLRACQQQPGIAPSDRLLAITSIAFDIHALELYLPLISGASVHIASRELTRDGHGLRDYLLAQNISVFQATPSTWKLLLAAGWHECRDQFQSLKALIGGEAFSCHLVQQLLPSLRELWNVYGPTETTVWSMAGQIIDGDKPIVLGDPIANTQIYLLDSHQYPVPVGVTGELIIGGAGVARGYLNRSELTQERFIDNPFHEQGSRLYRTGDLARRLDDGSIEFLGRNDFQLKIQGHRVEPSEIEAALLACEGVSDAVVNSYSATDDRQLVAYFIGDESVDPERLSAQLKDRLASHMLPSAYIRLDALPMTANGKLDRNALPSPDRGDYRQAHYEAPIDERESLLAKVWADLLPIDQVGRWDNFFDLGGHSLLAVQLMARLCEAGLQLDIRTLFNTPILADLAQQLSLVDDLPIPPNAIPAGTQTITPDMLGLVDLTHMEIDSIAATVRGGAANIQDIYPLAPLQEGILYHHLLDAKNDPYLRANVLAFDHRADLDKFLSALQWLVARHDILRTAILWKGLSEPLQVVLRQAPLTIETLDIAGELAGLEKDHLSNKFRPLVPPQWRHRIGDYPIDIEQAPLIRVLVGFDTRQDRWLMMIVNHHIIIDHTGLEVLIEEINAYISGQTLAPAVPFRDYVSNMRRRTNTDAEKTFFTQMLGDMNEPTAPFGIVDVLGNSSRTLESQQLLDSKLARRLRVCAKQYGVSPASLFHFGFARLLGILSGRDEVVFGTVLSGRMDGGRSVDRALGIFMNTLPIRINVGDIATCLSVNDTHQRLVDLLDYEHVPLSLAQQCSGVQLPAPLFTALLNYRHSHIEHSSQPQSAVKLLSSEEGNNYPLSLAVDDLQDDFNLTLRVMDTLDCADIVAYMQQVMGEIAAALETAPETLCQSLSVLTRPQRQRILEDWNTAACEYSWQHCIHSLFETQVESTPDVVALVYKNQTLSYQDLNCQANQLSHYLSQQGVSPGDIVALCVQRSFAMVVGLLAVLKAGAAYVPLDPSYPKARLQFILSDCKPRLLLSDGCIDDIQQPMPGDIPVIDLLADWMNWQHESIDNPLHADLTASDLCYVIYTSGSTERPKGVMVRHENIVNHILWRQHHTPLGVDDRVLQKTTFGFDISVLEFFWPLTTGAGLVLPRGQGEKDPPYLCQLMAAAGVSVVQFVPSMLTVLLEEGDVSDCSRLRHIYCGGEALTPSLLSRCRERLPECQIHQVYGPTETCIDTTCWSCPTDFSDQVIPIGRPIANTQLYILDQWGEPVPVGVTGEIYIGGVGVAEGYLNRPELTQTHFIEDSFSDCPQARLYKTGDLGRWTVDGMVEFLGRSDFQVKLRGFRVELGEVEAVLRDCNGIRDALVLADQEGSRLIAYCLSYDAILDIEDLQSTLSANLPDYMVPSAYVRLESFPLNANGKLDRKALPAPEGETYVRQQYEAPSSDIEIEIATIWEKLLEVEKIGRWDSFFSLGGHSLLSIALVREVKNEIDVDITLADIFEHPTLNSLAERVLNLQLQQFDESDLENILFELEENSIEEKKELLEGI